MKIYTHYLAHENIDSNLAEVIHTIKENFRQITQRLKLENKRWSLTQDYLYQKPWFLVLGPHQSGKTTLFSNAGLSNSQHFGNNESAWLWLLKDVIYIDIAGKFISNKTLLPFWNGLASCLKSLRRQQPFDGIILTFDLQQLIEQPRLQREAQIADINKILQSLTAKLNKKIPVHLILSHGDYLAGFSDFFDDLSLEERQQPCGFLLPSATTTEELITNFNNELTKLLQNIHDRQITRLHQVRNIRQRYLIKDFPLQLESVRPIFQQLLKLLTHNQSKTETAWQISGMFITSNLQAGLAQDYLAKTISQNFSLTTQTTISQSTQNKSFFSNHLLQKILPYHRMSQRSFVNLTHSLYTNRFFHLGIACLTILFVAILIKNFSSKVTAFSKAEDLIQTYQLLNQYQGNYANPANQKQLKETLKEINILANASHALDKIQYGWLAEYPFSQTKETKQLTKQAYQRALHHDLLPRIALQIENELTEDKNPESLYATLKAYLMLGNARHFQANYLEKWIIQHLHSRSNIEISNVPELVRNIQLALKEQTSPVILNGQVIQKVRSYLISLPKAYLAFTLLKHTIHYQTQSLQSSDIPYLYTKEGFTDGFRPYLDKVTQEIVQGDWILGEIPQHYSQQDYRTLRQNLIDLYLNDYKHWWELYFYNQQTVTFKTIEQATQFLQAMQGDQSHLSILLETIKHNTAFITGNDELIQAFNKNISREFFAFNNINKNTIELMHAQLQQLYHYLHQLETTADSEQSAFQLAKQRFSKENQSDDPITKTHQIAKSMPHPLDDWLTSIASSSWDLVLAKTQNYLNQEWNKTVLAEYRDAIANRYPIDKHAQQDIPLKNFSHFFSLNGTLNNFSDSYLQAFLDTNDTQWKIKKIDDVGISISNKMIEQLMRAKLIRAMFFSDNSQEVDFSFALKPVAFEPVIKQLTFNIDGQEVTDTQGSTKKSYLHWPGDNESHKFRLSITNITGETFTASESGPWALLKLFDKANLEKSDDTQHYYLTFIVNDNAAKYELIADNIINPFIPNIIAQFELPDQVG